MAKVQKNTIDQIKTNTLAQSDTAKKVRYLLSEGKTVNEIYKLFKEYGVTTKAGGEIRYQMVRNYSLMPLTSKK